MGDNCFSFFSLYFMVFKFLQKFPLSVKSLIFQVIYGLVLFALVSFFGWSRTAFLVGFLFSQIYITLFFYSAFLLFKKKKQKLGMILMFIKWLLLFFILLIVSCCLEGKAFLIGFSALLSFLLCYILENIKKAKSLS